MGLSTDTLLHQTKFENLINILKQKCFKVSYSKEDIQCFTSEMIVPKGYKFVFPMISFSEIPISSLHNHLYRYGDCIIGMKKEWAIKNRLNQVHYYQKESKLTDLLLEMYNRYYQEVMGKNNKDQDIVQVFHHLELQIIHAKNYSGEVETDYFKDKNYFFAEEKEWRYVPDNENIGYTLSKKLEIFKDNEEEFQAKIGEKILRFEFDDIRFIVVDTEEQKEELAQCLAKTYLKSNINMFTNEEMKLNFFGYKNISIKEYKLLKEIAALKK